MPRKFPDWRRGDPADAERLTRQHKARNEGIVGGRGIDVVRGHDGLVIQLKETRIIPSVCCDIGACCLPGENPDDPVMCVPDVAEAVCISEGGEWPGAGVACDPDPCIGACCIDSDSPPDGNSETCVPDQNKVDCEEMEGGEFKGVGSKCLPNPCEEGMTGACCFGPACILKTESECEDQGGMFRGVGMPCMPNPCLTGACCHGEDNQTCVPNQTPDECNALEGIFKGSGSDCTPNPCLDVDDKGACCFGGACVPMQTPDECTGEGGMYQGHGTVCIPNPCVEQKGACCTGPLHNECVPELLEPVCVALGGIWQGSGVPCEPIDPCLPQNTGACCIEIVPGDGHVQCVPNRTVEQCTAIMGLFQGIGVPCFPNPCLDMKGACCFGPSCVADQTADECSGEGGIYQGDNVPCMPNPCPQDPDDPDTPGACCVGPICHPNHTRESCCLVPGMTDFFPNVGCMPNPCGNETGACCTGAAHDECVPDVTEGECCLLNMMPGHWVGAGTTCEPNDPCLNPDTTGACCFGPFDNMPPFEQECTPNLTIEQCELLPGPRSWHPNIGCVPLPDECSMGKTVGACCFGPFDSMPPFEQECEANLTLNECNAKPEPNSWHPGEPCVPLPAECMNPENKVWACCTGPPPPPDQACVPTTQMQCMNMEGTWYMGQVCWPDECLGDPDTGACCLPPWPVPNPECEDNWTVKQCNAVGGGWFLNQACIPAACIMEDDTTGACCFGPFEPNQLCLPVVTAADCLLIPDSSWHVGMGCDPVPLPCMGEPTGACCPSPGNIPCIITTAALCDGDYLGDGVGCGPPDPCIKANPGVCCIGPALPGEQEICQPAADEAECIAMEGTWHPGIPNCGPPNPCPFHPPHGACCIEDSGPMIPGTPWACDDLGHQDECKDSGGVWQGDGTTCIPNPCPLHPPEDEACCLPGINLPGEQEFCSDLAPEDCLFVGGNPQGPGSNCDPNPCPVEPFGACCFGSFNPNQQCEMVFHEQVCIDLDGNWHGFGSTCDPLPDDCLSEGLGLCCCAGDCSVVTQEECLADLGSPANPCTWELLPSMTPGGNPCVPNPCPCPGACCVSSGIAPVTGGGCVMANSEKICVDDFEGDWQGCGSSCKPDDPCMNTGACCIGESCIDDQTQAECKGEGGVFVGVGTTCASNPCPIEPIGKCCLPGGECADLPEQECIDLDGMWLGGTTCAQDPNCMGEAFDCCLDDPMMPGFCQCLMVADCEACNELGGTCHLLGWCGQENPDNSGNCCHACCSAGLGCEDTCAMTRLEFCQGANQTFHVNQTCEPPSPCDICCYCADGGDGAECKVPAPCPGHPNPPCYICATLVECNKAGCEQIMNLCCVS